jgi:hypothetical protein
MMKIRDLRLILLQQIYLFPLLFCSINNNLFFNSGNTKAVHIWIEEESMK